MVKRKVEINIISAEGLKLSSLFGKPNTYAVLWIDPSKKFYSRVTEEGASNPVWNHKMIIYTSNHALERGTGKITIEIFHRGHIHDKLLGSVEVPFKEIPEHLRYDPEPDCPPQYMAFEIRQPSGKPKGVLNLSIRLREISSNYSSSSSSESESEAPVTTHKVQEPLHVSTAPAPVPAPETYTPSPAAYSYPASDPGRYPPAYYPSQPPAYGYANPVASYDPGSTRFYNPQPGYQPAPPPPGPGYYGAAPSSTKKGHSNLALGAGIAAGALGGLVLGEVVEDIAENKAEEAVEDEDYGDTGDW